MSLRKILLFAVAQPLMAVPFPSSSRMLFSRSPSPQDPTPAPKAPDEVGPVSDAWMTANCTNAGVVDASLDPTMRWSLVDSKDALVAANNKWAGVFSGASADHVNLEYAKVVSNFFNGPEKWACRDIGNVPCSSTVQCHDTNHPAGYFILNSFSQLHQIHQEINTALTQAETDMQTQIGVFTSVFTTKFVDDTEWIKTLLDILGFSVALGSAFVWNRVATVVLNGVITSDQRGQYKDTFNAAIAFVVNAAKDNLPKATNDLDKQNNLNDAMGAYFRSWRDSISAYVDNIFSGGSEPLTQLTTLIGDGGFNYNTGGPNLSQLQQRTEAIVFAQLISTAWRTNPAQKLWPVILEFDNISCDAAGTLPEDLVNAMDAGTALQTHVCYNDKVYYMVQAVYRDAPICHKECVGGDPFAGLVFQALPGGTTDNFSDGKWSGVTLDNFVISSVDAWNGNGQKNGYSSPDAATYAAEVTDIDNNDLELHFEKVLQVPGIYQIPVCKAIDLSDIISKIGGDQGKPGGDWWPCNP